MQRRTAVELVIGHLKAEHRVDRLGNRINAILAAAGYDFGLLLRWLAELLRVIRTFVGTVGLNASLEPGAAPVLYERLLIIGIHDPTSAQHLIPEIVHVLQNEQAGDKPRWQAELSETSLAHRATAVIQNLPVDQRRQPHQRGARVDDLIEGRSNRSFWRSYRGLLIASSDADDPPPGNHELLESKIPERKKARLNIRLSCKIECFIETTSAYRSAFFTGDCKNRTER